ncbi:ileal sodium/bile acid cotransporter-like [Strongylocentrotus purpuratus]|uniref:Ileal sodium/bile acid cotransporter n=1 Tax=Strongylocentrotus purpuratus TaxID=7668 RepID=A0A7M7NNW7_STRPU|nr:ileal sodium/bile acid cotransporter-like [Strongylocentrotus purpuratus]
MKLPLASGLACCLLIILVINVDAQCGMDVFVNVSIAEETVYMFEGSEINTTITVNEVLVDGVLTFRSSNPAKFRVRDGDATTILTTSAVDLPFNITVVIEGRAISIESLEVLFKPSGSDELVELGKQTIGVKRIPQLLQAIYVYIVLAWILLSYLSMGGSIDPKEIWKNVRRPYGILIGLFCQFIIMPAMTYVIALLFAEDDATSVGIVLVGTAPGGWLSNIFCALLDVDLVLSITMTFFSSVIALGMMPLNLYIYATPFTTENQRLVTPYSELAQQLAILVIPLFIGMAISWKFPKFKKFCKKVVKPIAMLLIVVGIGMGVPADFYAFSQSPVNNWIVSILIPLFGAFFGLSFARIFGRNIRTSITIAIETGVQNALLARTIVFLFYPRPEADLLARIALTTILVTLLEGSFATFVYYTFRYILCRRRCEKMLTDDELDGEKAIAVDDIAATAIDENTDNRNGAENAAFQSEANKNGTDQ